MASNLRVQLLIQTEEERSRCRSQVGAASRRRKLARADDPVHYLCCQRVCLSLLSRVGRIDLAFQATKLS